MKVWIISDTHFRHANIIKYTGRPENFLEVIQRNWIDYVGPDDLVIHLGDVIFGTEKESWLPTIMNGLPGKKVLCRGNHDLKPWEFYIERGFDIVTDYFVYDRYAFSHAPLTPLPQQANENYKLPVALNFHGHFHNSNHRLKPNDPYYSYEYYEKNKDKYKLIQIEEELRPFSLEEVLAR